MFRPSEILLATVALYCVAFYAFRLLRQKLLIKQTAVLDLHSLGELRPHGHKLHGTAVICGGSIAGLVTARICHDHFERVIIVEPEAWLATAEGWDLNIRSQKNARSRIAQYRSIQGFQLFGFLALKKLFPNIEDECKNFDIHVLAADISKIILSGYKIPAPYEDYQGSLPKMAFPSRPGLETMLRRLVFGNGRYPNIEQVVGTVTGVRRAPDDPTCLEGVTIRTKEGELMLPAALVVDCTGPARASIKWLRHAGFDTADSNFDDDASIKQGLDQLKLVYDHKVQYVTFEFSLTPSLVKRIPADCGYDTAGFMYGCNADARYGNNLHVSRVEGDTIHITCGTRGGVVPPRDLDGVKEFTKDLVLKTPIPDWFHQLLDLLAEVEDTMTYSAVRVSPATYIRYHQAPNLPRNWIAIGDSIMSVNPVYGQGCNKAIIGATTLNTLLKSLSPSVPWPANWSRHFFETQAGKIEPIWDGTKTMDYGYNTTVPVTNENLSQGTLIRWYLQRMWMVASHDRQAASAWWHVIMFLAPGIDYFQPGIVLKVLWSCLTIPSFERVAGK